MLSRLDPEGSAAIPLRLISFGRTVLDSEWVHAIEWVDLMAGFECIRNTVHHLRGHVKRPTAIEEGMART